ncbi:unnamed protein product [Leuciscus chuanchicus]
MALCPSPKRLHIFRHSTHSLTHSHTHTHHISSHQFTSVFTGADKVDEGCVHSHTWQSPISTAESGCTTCRPYLRLHLGGFGDESACEIFTCEASRDKRQKSEFTDERGDQQRMLFE